MKLFKNKKNKALMTAVTMSLVMGVCGNALAASDYYGTNDKEWTTNKEQAQKTNFNGEWNANSGSDKGVAANVYGGYSSDSATDKDCANNIVTIRNATVDNVYGGYGVNVNASKNTVDIYRETTVNNSVYGGYSENAAAIGNIVNFRYNYSFKGSVVAGYGGTLAKDNIVNLPGGVNIEGTIYGGRVSEGGVLENNTLNVNPIMNKVGGIAGFQNINIVVPNLINPGYPRVPDMEFKILDVNDAIDLDKLESVNAIYNSDGQKKYEYRPGTTTVLLSSPNSDFTKLSTDKLKIDGIQREYVELDQNHSDLKDIKDIDAIKAVAGFDISQTAIKFITQVRLVDTLNLDKVISLRGRVIYLNGQTINMILDNMILDNKLNALYVKKLIGTANLNIDVDMNNTRGWNDLIYIVDETSNATLNLNKDSINVVHDEPGLGVGTGKMDVILSRAGDIKGLTLNVANDSIKTATSNYIYTFTKESDTKLNFARELPGTFAEFIVGSEKYADVASYAINENVVADADLGKINRGKDDKSISLAFNKDISLSGNGHEGVVVAPDYTLKLER